MRPVERSFGCGKAIGGDRLMAIFREPLATKNFTQVPNHWLRDPRLTAKAKGILAYIASHSPGYELSVAQIIAEMKDGESAVKAALRELESVGYLRRRQRRDDNGRLSGTDYWIVESPDPGPTVGRFSASGKSSGGEPSGGKSASGSSTSGGSGTKNTKTKNTKVKNTTEGSAVQCRTSGRSAPADAGDPTDDDELLILSNTTPRTSGWSDWRQQDLELLTQLIGSDKVISDGTVSPEAVYPVRMVYESLQRLRVKPKDWPGLWLKEKHDANPDSGVLDWLARYGLEPSP